MNKITLSTILILLLAAGCNQKTQIVKPTGVTITPPVVIPSTPVATPLPSVGKLSEPISGGVERVTKKTFGLYVSPGHSPVSPEKFTGYHTGDDFETTPAEANIDVGIYAACGGKVLLKKYATGYGGVMVQSCKLNGSDVTILYGHLRLSSIVPTVGSQITAGEKLAVLGTGYSTETDGERKHLHFAVHKGTAVNILGYVQKESGLSGWADPMEYLK